MRKESHRQRQAIIHRWKWFPRCICISSLLLLATPCASSQDLGEKTSDIIYKNVEGNPLRLDLYPAIESTEPSPVVIVVHGGSWKGGSKSEEQVVAVCQILQRAGFCAAAVDYRVSPHCHADDMIRDLLAACQFLVENANTYRLDPNSIGIIGFSAGAHLSLFLAMTDTWPIEQGESQPSVKAVVNVYGPTALTLDWSASQQESIASTLAGPSERALNLRKYSLLTYVSDSTCPIFTIHGEDDRIVPPGQAQRLHDALNDKGVANQIRMVKGMDHWLAIDEERHREALDEAIEFLGKNLAK